MVKLSDGFMWRQYCFHHEFFKMEVKEPKSLCNFFWSAMSGMTIDRLASKIEKFKAWHCLLASVIFFTISYITLYSAQYIHPLATILSTCISIIAGTGFLAGAFCLSVCWISSFLERHIEKKKLKFIYYLGLFVLGWGLLLFTYNDPDATKIAGKVVLWTPVFIVAMFAAMTMVVAIAAGITIGICYLFNRAAAYDVVKTTGMFLCAVKNKVCPLVEPPESFKKKAENERRDELLPKSD